MVVVASTKDLFYFLKKVQRKAGRMASSSFPSSPTDAEQEALDAINEYLRFLNNKYYFIFQQTEYTLTTTSGVVSYDLTQAPYSQSMWRVFRLARNGVRRAADDTEIPFIDYTERDMLRPASSATGAPAYHSAYGASLLFDRADGSQVKIRYYGLHIGTDTTGATQKLNLSATDDLVMLDDNWEDVLITGAASILRAFDTVDEKTAALQDAARKWEGVLEDMGNQPGEDAGPRFVVRPYVYNDALSSYYPFGTPYENY